MGRAGGFTSKRLFFVGRPEPNALEANQVVSRFCVCVCVCVVGTSAFRQRGAACSPPVGACGRPGGWDEGSLGLSGRGQASPRKAYFLKDVPSETLPRAIRWSVVFGKFALTNF